jgi:integrase/recombinase XerD
MKHLPIRNRTHELLLNDFGRYLQRLGYGKSTQNSLPSCLREFFYRMEQQQITGLENITSDLIRNHYEYLGQRPNQQRPGTLSASLVNHHIYALKTFIKYQEENGNISKNPFSALNFPKPKYPPRRVLSREEINALYEACQTMREKALLALFYGCGLRRSEAEKLNIDDVNFKNQLLYVRLGKGKRRRVVPMTEQVKKDMENYYKHERIIYMKELTADNQKAFVLNNHGNRMLGNGYWNKFKCLTQKAGLPKEISLHHLRHSIATHLLESGLSIEQVRDFLGHRHLESTQIYTRIKISQMS